MAKKANKWFKDKLDSNFGKIRDLRKSQKYKNYKKYASKSNLMR